MTPAQFVSTFLSEAQICASGTGLNPCLFLAQWADETGWGTSRAFSVCRNLAGINPFNGYSDCDGYAQFSSYTESAHAEVTVLHNGLYSGVLATAGQSFDTQARALGNSPWASGKYDDGGGPGSALISIYNASISPYTSCPQGSSGSSPNPPPVIIYPVKYTYPSGNGILAGVLLIGAGATLGAIVLVTDPRLRRQLSRDLRSLERKTRKEAGKIAGDISERIPG